MTELTTLPNEIIVMIVGKIAAHCAPLCFVSKFFRDVTEPILYRNPIQPSRCNLQILLLLRTLLCRPQLANHIQKLKIEKEGWKISEENPFSKNLSEEEQKLLDKRITDTAIIPSLETGRIVIDSQALDAAVAMILSKCDNLKYIVFKFNDDAAEHFREKKRAPRALFSVLTLRLSSLRSNDTISFSRLENVTLGAENGKRGPHAELSFSEVLPCFYLPNIKRLDCEDCKGVLR